MNTVLTTLVAANRTGVVVIITACGGRLTWGPTLVVAGEEFQPHVVVRKAAEGRGFTVEGPAVELLNLVASQLNFT